MDKKPIVVISDTHYHNFTQFAVLNSEGINTRLDDIIRATRRAVNTLIAIGGDTLIHCGDVFHVRGAISPTVLNPVLDLYAEIIALGIKVYMISGNHDLESNDAKDLSSTVTALANVGVTVINKPTLVDIDGVTWDFVPWIADLNDLRKRIRASKGNALVLHAPMNGVITGLPDHGLTVRDFDDCQPDTILIGHYHNHKVFTNGSKKIISVGALTHQNWGDVDARAGYLVLRPNTMIPGAYDHAQHNADSPKFIKIDVADITHPKIDWVGNYFKITGTFADPAAMQIAKDEALLQGAKAVMVAGVTTRPVTSRGVTSSAAPTIHTVLGEYMDRTYAGDADAKLLALEILGEVYD